MGSANGTSSPGAGLGGPGNTPGSFASGMSGNGAGGQSDNVGSFAEGAFSGNQFTRAGAGTGNTNSGSGGEGGGQQSSKGFASNNQGNANNNGPGRPGTFQDAMNAAAARKRAVRTLKLPLLAPQSTTAQVAAPWLGQLRWLWIQGPGGVEVNPQRQREPMLD